MNMQNIAYEFVPTDIYADVKRQADVIAWKLAAIRLGSTNQSVHVY